MTTNFRYALCGFFGAALLLAVGCNSQPPLPKTFTVTGTVNYKGGQAMKGGSIQFNLASDPIMRVIGEIGADGAFTLRTIKDNQNANGAPEGEYQVVVQPPMVEMKGGGGQGKPATPITLAQKYKIEAKDNTLKIELPVSPP